jgi:hypothetical protein
MDAKMDANQEKMDVEIDPNQEAVSRNEGRTRKRTAT